MKIRYLLLSLFLIICLAGWGPFSFFSWVVRSPIGSRAWFETEMKSIISQASNLNPTVLKLSLTAYLNARQKGLDTKQVLTIIDYSKPSTERRLWVVDLKRAKVLFNTWVSHGKNSGRVLPTSFSNQLGSLKSSIGVFLTDEPYVGGNGYSLRLRGLEAGFNDKAYQRNVVVHGAWYADEDVAKQYGLLGRSWGCPAVSQKIIKPLIDTIKDETLIVVYYPDRKWLNNSRFLTA